MPSCRVDPLELTRAQREPSGALPALRRHADGGSGAQLIDAVTLAPETPAGDTVLEVRDYRVWFPIRKGLLKRTVGYVKAVDGVSFSIAAGRTLALVGESGSGKTTVGKAVLQLLRDTAQISGEALLDGQPLRQLHGDQLRLARRAAQIVFQDPFASLNPRMRVREILEEGVAALRPDLAGTKGAVASGCCSSGSACAPTR
jgi:peptide/nickel transport system ATP-binding protein